mgnify:CR=1 FL=1
MPNVKSLIKRVTVETAKRRRTCKNTHATIPKGALSLVVMEDQYVRSCYGKEVALEMLRQSRKRLDEIEMKLEGKLPADGSEDE